VFVVGRCCRKSLFESSRILAAAHGRAPWRPCPTDPGLFSDRAQSSVLHERVLLVAVTMAETPRISDEDRIEVTPISDGITRVELRFGFMEQPNVPNGLHVAMARRQIAQWDLGRVTYYTGHETMLLWAGGRAWRAGAKNCSRSCTTTPSGLALISKFRADKSWKSASSSRSELRAARPGPASQTIATGDVRFPPRSFAKVRKGVAADFPPKNETGDNRRLIGLKPAIRIA
jgi:hypothetical protein